MNAACLINSANFHFILHISFFLFFVIPGTLYTMRYVYVIVCTLSSCRKNNAFWSRAQLVIDKKGIIFRYQITNSCLQSLRNYKKEIKANL